MSEIDGADTEACEPSHSASSASGPAANPSSEVGPSSSSVPSRPQLRTIKSKRDFERVFRGGKRLNHPLVRITAMPVEDGKAPRVAFVAAKRLGNAVCRNRCKRVLRAAARETGLPLTGYDVILFATRETRDASSTEVAAALGKLVRRLERGRA